MNCLSCKSPKVSVRPTLQGDYFEQLCLKCRVLGKKISKSDAIELVANHVIYHGRHKGKKFHEVPMDYIRWLADNSQGDLTEMAKFWLRIKG